MKNEKLVQLLTAVSIAAIWIICDFINMEIFHFLKTDKYLYSIYWLAGLRLLSIILFGYVGFIGIFLGQTFSSIFIKDLAPGESICLAFLSSLATLIAYKLWQLWIGKDDSFFGISPIQLFYLVIANATLVAMFRFGLLLAFNREVTENFFYGTVAANITGSLLVLYIIKAGNCIYRRI